MLQKVTRINRLVMYGTTHTTYGTYISFLDWHFLVVVSLYFNANYSRFINYVLYISSILSDYFGWRDEYNI